MSDSASWDDLRFFGAVARTGNLSAAARLLCTDQSTVSRRLQHLERALGVVLVERNTTGCALTSLGEALVPQVAAMEQAALAVDDLVQRDARDVDGLVRVAMTEGLAIHFWAPIVMPTLCARHPGLRIDLVTSSVPADLARHEADIAVRFYRVAGGDLVTRKVGAIRRVVAGRHDVVAGLPDRCASTPLPWIGVDPDTYDAAWLQTVPHRRPVLTSSSYETHLAGLRAGLGVGVVPAAYLDLYRELVAVDVGGLPPPIDVYLVTRKTARKVPKVAAVWDVVLELAPALVGPA